jgi:hypothetical protein
MQNRGEFCVRIFAKVVRGPIPRAQKAITLQTAITMSAGIEWPIPCVQFVFLEIAVKLRENLQNNLDVNFLNGNGNG